MKHALGWKVITRIELAEHLRSSGILRSQALGESSIYHCEHTDNESIAIALPDGSGLVITKSSLFSPATERRKTRRNGS